MTRPPRHAGPVGWQDAPTRRLPADLTASDVTDTGTLPVIGPGPVPPRPVPPGPPAGAPGPASATPAGPPARSTTSLLRNTGSMAVPTLISRITGFGKATAIAAVLGIGAAADSFNLANTLPNIISELVLGAVLTSVVVPVLVRAEREDADGGTAFVRRLLTVSGVVLAVSTVLAVLCAPLLTNLYLSEDSAADSRLATLFAFLLLPQIFFYGYSALFGAILNTRGVFGLVAWAPVINNVVTLLTLGVYLLTPGELEVSAGNPRLLVLGIGTTLGIVAQAAVVVPALRRAGVDLRPQWGLDQRLKEFAGMGAAVVAYVVVSQVGLVVTNNVASRTDGGLTTYSYAWLLLQVPYGVLGVSLLTAIMPRMSRAAAAGDDRSVLADLSLGSRLTSVALVPIIVLFTAHGTTLGVALFSYGNSDVAAGDRLGATVAASAFGLLPYAVALLQLRVFYARQQAWVPTAIVLCMVAVKVPLQLLGPQIAGDRVIEWLALSNALSFVVGALVGAVLLRRRLGPLGSGALARTVGLAVAAAVVALGVDLVVGLVLPLHRLTEELGGPGAVLEFGVHAVLVLGTALGLMLALRMPEVDALRPLVRKVTGRRRPDPRGPVAAPAVTPVHGTSGRGRLPYPGPVQGHEHGRGTGGRTVGAEADRTAGTVPSGALPAPGPADEPTTRVRGTVRGPRLVPGAAVAGGRYRLLAAQGGSGTLVFWQARDTVLDRDVALTFVDAAQAGAGADPAQEGPQAVLSRTQRLGRLSSPAVARVLDVVRGSSGGIVVAEWTAGRSLREVAATEPSPVGAARAVRALAAAAEQAHRAGTALAIDHPDRVRISSGGTAVLAFPGVTAGADPAADVRGLGAVLYGLITAHWPLPAPGGSPTGDEAVGGMPRAPLTREGHAVEPRRLRSSVPFEISTVTARSLEPRGGLRTAAAVQTVLDQAAVLDQQTDMFPVVRDDDGYDGPYDDEPLDDHEDGPVRRGRVRRSRKLLLALVLFAVVAVLVLAFVFRQVTGFFGGGEPEQPLPSLEVDPNTGAGVVEPGQTADPGLVPPVPVAAAEVTVFSPEGTADDAQDAGLAVDGDPATVWSSDEYNEQFPAFKNGLGLLVTLTEAGTLATVGIDSPSAGTVVEIRSAPSAGPTLEQTTVLATATLVAGRTDVTVEAADPTQHVLVWITQLSTEGGLNQSSIAEITVARAG